jgi:hypothetical protein
MLNVETGIDKRFTPQTEGAIELKSSGGQKVMAYPGTFLYIAARKALEKLGKEEKDEKKLSHSN